MGDDGRVLEPGRQGDVLAIRDLAIWDGEDELCEIGGLSPDVYVLLDGSWRFASRVEEIRSVEGGRSADIVRGLAEKARGHES